MCTAHMQTQTHALNLKIIKINYKGKWRQAFNPSTWEAEAGRFLSSRPAWSTE
jgi:major histocompatibility complex class I